MADLGSISAVRLTSDSQTEQHPYGATIAAGDSVYLDSADSKIKLADADSSATTAAARGIAVTPGVDGSQGVIASGGTIVLVGTTMAVGEPYVVSANAGKIAPATDQVTDDYVTLLGVAKTATELRLNIDATGIQHA